MVEPVMKKNIKVVVTGGRKFADARLVFRTLDKIHSEKPISLLIEGGALGADRLCRNWAIQNSVPYRTFPPDWDNFKRAAGHIRNQQMIDEGKPDFAVAFPGGPGTRSMISKLKKAKIPTLNLHEQGSIEDDR